MTEQKAEFGAIVSRLERVETENRRMKQAGLALIVLITVLLLVAQARPSRTIEAQQFVLKDANGRVRAELGIDPKMGGQLSIYNEVGSQLAALNGIWLRLDDPQHRNVTLGSIGVEARKSRPMRIMYGVSISTPDGASTLSPDFLRLSDSDGFATIIGRTDLETVSTGETRYTSAASLLLFDKNSKVLWSAP